MKTTSLLTVLLVSLLAACAGSKTTGQQGVVVMSYNVENLFDTSDDPHTRDNDFLPQGELEWDATRYQQKLDKLAQAIALVPQAPAVLGLCEIENRTVLEHLSQHPTLAKYNYQVVHRDSPDPRGIDVAFLYQPALFAPLAQKWVAVVDSANPHFKTRDVLYLCGTVGADTLHLYMNHWPSRAGGEEESVDKRGLAAAALRQQVDSLLAVAPQAKILIMGDLNDEPTDPSVADVLRAKMQATGQAGDLIDLMAPLQNLGKGTYFYRDGWNMLDHLIVSPGLYNAPKGLTTHEEEAVIFAPDELVFVNKKNERVPNRTFAGRKKYVGGTSDHFPVYVTLRKR